MPGQARELLLIVLAGKKAFEKFGRISDLLNPDPELVSLTHRKGFEIAACLRYLFEPTPKQLRRKFPYRDGCILAGAVRSHLDPFQHIDQQSAVPLRGRSFPGALKSRLPPRRKLLFERVPAPVRNDFLYRAVYFLLDENVKLARSCQLACQPL